MGSGRKRARLRWTAAVLGGLAVFLFGFLSGRAGQHETAVSHADGVVAQAAREIRERTDAEVTDSELTRAAIEGMLGVLDDDYAAYFVADDQEGLRRLLDGRYTGVGLWLARERGEPVRVVSVVPESTAARAGVVVGDEVVAVAGRAVADREVADVVRSLRGTKGTAIEVSLRRNGVTRQVMLEREEVLARDVEVSRLRDDVAMVRVAAFTRGVGRTVRDQLATLRAQDVRGVVLDLRGNPGGLLHEGVEVASAFLNGGTVVTYSGRGVERRQFDAVGKGDERTSLVVLVDGGTASSAEIVAAALQDRGRAVVVGSRTYGKGSVQLPITLADGSAIELTVARYLTPNGRSLERVGVTPDIDVAPGADGRAALRRALDVLAGLVADAGPAQG